MSCINLNLIISYENLYNLIIVASSFIHVQCIIAFSTKSSELIFVLEYFILDFPYQLLRNILCSLILDIKSLKKKKKEKKFYMFLFLSRTKDTI